jgi:hypothetical protein
MLPIRTPQLHTPRHTTTTTGKPDLMPEANPPRNTQSRKTTQEKKSFHLHHETPNPEHQRCTERRSPSQRTKNDNKRYVAENQI